MDCWQRSSDCHIVRRFLQAGPLPRRSSFTASLAGLVSLHRYTAADRNHLRLYDLKTGAKKDEYLFPDAPVYTHFSADGKQLLVLTAQQLVFVLDVAVVGSSSAVSQ